MGPGSPDVKMKSMKLYNQVGRIYNELRELGIGEDAPLQVSQLTPYDQYHYHGTDSLDAAITQLSIGPDARVLEVGSGIGGPARYLTEAAGCHVTALELQSDLNQVAADLTRRCGLSSRVEHVNGNVMDGAMTGRGFDALVSLLVFLHIPGRRELFSLCYQALRPGGRMFIEDFTKRIEPSPAQWEDLHVKVQCPSLETEESYRGLLEEAGFTDIVIEDMSNSWTTFTTERYAMFQAARDRNLRVHGAEIVDGLDDFYRVASELYAQGVVGGARICATRP